MEEKKENNIVDKVTKEEYKYGFVTDVESDTIPKGLNEDIIRMISKRKMSRLAAQFPPQGIRPLADLEMPHWAHLDIPLSIIRTSITTPPPSPNRPRRMPTEWTPN